MKLWMMIVLMSFNAFFAFAEIEDFDRLLRERMGITPTSQKKRTGSIDLNLVLALHPRMRHWIPQAQTFLQKEFQGLDENRLRLALQQNREEQKSLQARFREFRNQEYELERRLNSARHGLLNELNDLRERGASESTLNQAEVKGFENLEKLAQARESLQKKFESAQHEVSAVFMNAEERAEEFGVILKDIEELATRLQDQEELEWLADKPWMEQQGLASWPEASLIDAASEVNLLKLAYSQTPVAGYGDQDGQLILNTTIKSLLQNWSLHEDRLSQWLRPVYQNGILAFSGRDYSLEILEGLWERYGISAQVRQGLRRTLLQIREQGNL